MLFASEKSTYFPLQRKKKENVLVIRRKKETYFTSNGANTPSPFLKEYSYTYLRLFPKELCFSTFITIGGKRICHPLIRETYFLFKKEITYHVL